MATQFARFIRSIEKAPRYGKQVIGRNIAYVFEPCETVSTPSQPPSLELSKLVLLLAGEFPLIDRLETIAEVMSTDPWTTNAVLKFDDKEGIVSRIMSVHFQLELPKALLVSASISYCNLATDFPGDLVLIGTMATIVSSALGASNARYSCLLNIGAAVLSDAAPAYPYEDWKFTLPELATVREYMILAKSILSKETDLVEAFKVEVEDE